jgi:hypothetical protein
VLLGDLAGEKHAQAGAFLAGGEEGLSQAREGRGV